MQVYTEVTVFMQKAIYYVSRLIAARGVLELTDRKLNFEVAAFDSSFGIKNVSLEISEVREVNIECGDLHPRIVLITDLDKYEFVLSRGQELYDKLKSLISKPAGDDPQSTESDLDLTLMCKCGREVNSIFRFCPWCGSRM